MKVQCKICYKFFEQITYGHLHYHNTTIDEYKIKFPDAKILSDERFNKLSLSIIGNKNPMKRASVKEKFLGDKNSSKRLDVRAKISKKQKGIKETLPSGNKGKKHPQLCGINNPANRPEVKIKISKSLKNSEKFKVAMDKQCGDNNPMRNPKIAAKVAKANTGKPGLKGKDNPNWNGGTSFLPYCEKFNNILRNKIRQRDDYQCQYPGCLCTQLESKVLYHKSLHVHHVHYDKPNCDPDLITLCNKHNSKVNANRDYWENLFTKMLKERGL